MTNFLKTNAEGKSVLEYGCGTGSLINLSLGARAKKTTGIDISEVVIGQAKQKYEKEVAAGKVSFQVMDAEALEFSDSTFDLICGKSILHHLDLMNTRFYSRTCTWPRNIFNKLNCIIFD